jgi:ABC-type branched-subunit amino acid transport system substrate-binding protein/tetratricopeptide (TPR) repeat protein
VARRLYFNFDLGFTRGPEGRYVARVTSSPAGDGSVEFEIPFNDLALENFYLKIGRPRHGVRAAGSSEAKAAREHGETLFNAVFQGSVREAFSGSMAVASAKRDDNEHRYGLRIRLNLTDTPELGELPWEFLWDPAHRNHLVTSERTPIVRYVDAPVPVTPLVVDGPLRMLCVISDPSGVIPLDVEHEWDLLRNHALRDLIDRGRVILDRLEPPTLGALHAALRANDYHVLHFVGHGAYDTDRGEGILVFETDTGVPENVTADRLAIMTQDEDSLRLVVLNACEGARAGRGDIYSGTAQRLVFSGIPAVVGMQFEFTDNAAIALAHELYRSIAAGYPIDAAVGEARKAIYASHNDIEWGTPVLFMRTPDGQLFSVDPKPEVRVESLREAAAAAVATGDYERAVMQYEELKHLAPEDEELRLALEQAQTMLQADLAYGELAALADHDEWDELLSQLDHLAEVAPEYPDHLAYRDQATQALMVGSQREAAGLVTEARRLLETEDYDAAINALERAASLDPDETETDELLQEAHDRVFAADIASKAVTAAQADNLAHAVDLLVGLEELPHEVTDPYTELVVDLREQRAVELAAPPEPEGLLRRWIWRVRRSPKTPTLVLAGGVGIGLFVLLLVLLWPSPDPTPGRLGAVTVAAGDPIEIRALQTLEVDGAPDDPAVEFAADQIRGIELAIEDFGAVHGHSVNLGPVVNDQCAEEGGTTGATAIGDQPGIVGVIGPTCTSAATPAAEILSHDGSVLVSASSSDPSLTTDSGDGAGANWQPGFYRTAFNDAQHGVAAANFARDDLGARSAAAIYLADATLAKTVAEAFANEFQNLGGDVRTEEVSVSTLAADLARLSGEPPEVIFFYTTERVKGAAIASTVDDIPALGEVTLVSSQLLLFDEFLRSPASEGMYFSVQESLSSDNVSATGVSYDEVTSRYEETYGEPPRTSGAFHAYAYDATVLLLSAINQVAIKLDGGALFIDRQELRDALTEVENLPGLTGMLTCREFGDCGDPTISIVHNEDRNRPDLTRSNIVYTYPP